MAVTSHTPDPDVPDTDRRDPSGDGSAPDAGLTAPDASSPPSGLASDLAAAQARIAELEARERRRRPLLIGCFVIVALVIGAPLVATAILGLSGSTGAAVQTVGFGTGGSDCTLTGVASSFPRGVPIRDVLTFAPALPAGGTVTVTVERNGIEVPDMGETVTVDEPSDCIHGTMLSLEPGHYRVEYDVSPDSVPPISGEFDVTP